MKLVYKYFLMIAVPILLCLFIIGTSLSFLMYNYSVSEKHGTLSRTTAQASELVLALSQNHTLANEQIVRTILTSLSDDGRIHTIVCDENGEIFLTSDNRPNQYISSFVSRSILEKTALSEKFTSIGTLDGLYRGQNYTLGIPVKTRNGNLVAYIFSTISVEDLRMLMMYVIRLFFLLALIVFVFTAIACYFIVKRTTRPLNNIFKATRSFTMGDFKTRVPVESNDEIGELTVAFNQMADSLEKSEELRRSFVANVSHELRSPMTSIGGFVDGILDGTIPPERESHYLAIISDEVHRLSRLVSRMLDITTLQSKDITAESKTFDFGELVRRAAISLEARINEKNLLLDICIPEEKLNISANEDAIFQVVYNLIDNAVKFAHADTQITLDSSKKGDKLSFSVTNIGDEIPNEQLVYVFDRFHKADNSRSKDKAGLGLGLYIAKTIVNQHKGQIYAKSKNGHTEFSFVIPVRQQAN